MRARGGARSHCPVASWGAYPQDPLSAARRPRPSTHTHHAPFRRRTGRPPACPGTRAGRTGALARPAP
eukprot:2647525-Prymnesium_polylepis.1